MNSDPNCNGGGILNLMKKKAIDNQQLKLK